MHCYEPDSGHGLRHDPFNAIVAPRPIGWISSRDAKGNVNLAPYSFFNGFNYTADHRLFLDRLEGHRRGNIQETGEFVWNLATMDIAQADEPDLGHGAREVDEFALAGLTPVPSRLVKVPRVAESPVTFECKLTEIIQSRAPTAKRPKPG